MVYFSGFLTLAVEVLTVIIMSSKQGNSVQLSTFKKWPVGTVIGYKTNNINSREMVTEVWCKLCARHAEKIKLDSRIKGKILSEVDRYVTGSKFVTKWTVLRHLESVQHKVAMEQEQLAGPSMTSPDVIELPESQAKKMSDKKQPRIDVKMEKCSRDAQKRLIKTAYLMAVDGQPLTSFKTLINVQKANGVKLIKEYDNSNRAHEFVHLIAESIRDRLADIIAAAKGFSILSDGSQARKTNSEKELIYIRLVRNGDSTFFCVALQDIDKYGDATAEHLKLSIDDVFHEKITLTEAKYERLLICATADGASVNTGQYNGLLARLQQDNRPWLLKVHCVSHRLELAFKDSLETLEEIKDFMISLYYLFKRSGKFGRQFRTTAEALGVQVYKMPKVHGTRFVAHQRHGAEVLLSNWIVLANAVENVIANKENARLNPKLRGILKKLQDYQFLQKCKFYYSVLDIVSKLSLKFERDQLFVFEIWPAVEQAKDELQNYLLENDDIAAPVFGNRIRNITLDEEGANIICSLPRKGHMKRKLINRDYIVVSYSVDKMKHVTPQGETDSIIQNLKKSVGPEIQKCLSDRFNSFQGELYKSMFWLDPANWVDNNQEIKAISNLASHFEIPLTENNFDVTKVKSEWKNLKSVINRYYENIKPRKIWNKVLKYRSHEYPNMSLLVEIMLCIGVSNSTVEGGFSHLTALLTDRRLSMSHELMEDLMVIKTNHQLWTAAERDDIIEQTLLKFTEKKRRKTMIDETPFNMLGISGPKRRHQDSESGASDSGESESGVSSMEVVDLDESSDIDNYVEANSSDDDDIEVVDIAEAYLDTLASLHEDE